MKNMTKSLVAAAVLASMGLSSTAVMAEEAASPLSANAAVVTNYVFRGATGSDEGPALQGGLDYVHESGAYAGTWLSTIDTGAERGFEYDLYLGYAGEAEEIGYDVGFIRYATTDSKKLWDDMREFYLKGSYDMFNAGIYFGDDDNSKENYTYVEFGADIEGVIPMDAVLNLHLGRLDGDAVAEAANDLSVGVSKNVEGFDVNATFTTRDADGDKNYIWVGVSKGFSL